MRANMLGSKAAAVQRIMLAEATRHVLQHQRGRQALSSKGLAALMVSASARPSSSRTHAWPGATQSLSYCIGISWQLIELSSSKQTARSPVRVRANEGAREQPAEPDNALPLATLLIELLEQRGRRHLCHHSTAAVASAIATAAAIAAVF